jgi:hypothetical protein
MLNSALLVLPPFLCYLPLLIILVIHQSQLVQSFFLHSSPTYLTCLREKIPHFSQQLFTSAPNWRARPWPTITGEDAVSFLASSGCLLISPSSMLGWTETLPTSLFLTCYQDHSPRTAVWSDHISPVYWGCVCYVEENPKPWTLYTVLLTTQPQSNIKLAQ